MKRELFGVLLLVKPPLDNILIILEEMALVEMIQSIIPLIVIAAIIGVLAYAACRFLGYLLHELFNLSDPCELLSVQFFSDDLFDPLEIIPQTDWEEYFRAVAAMIKEEWSTGTEKVTKTMEMYVDIAFELIVNNVFAGRQGIVEIRSKAQSAHTWFQRVEVINEIPKKTKGEEGVIRRLVTGYTLLRQLRNKSHHPGEVEITYSDMMVSLSTLIFVHNELFDLLELLIL